MGNNICMMIKSLISLIILNIFILPLIGQDDSTASAKPKKVKERNTFALFEGDELLDVTISFDLGAYMKKNLKGQALEGEIVFHLNKTDSVDKNIKIKPRGIFRKQECSFPPMEVNFNKPLPAYSNSGSIKKLKLVTHCEQGKLADDNVLREFLVYKLFNVLTDTSFRVRIAHIRYVDSKKKKQTISQYGFFIEPSEILAERLNSVTAKKISISQRSVIPDIMTRIAIFNYMIGNYDWAVPNQHNILILKSLNPLASQLAIAVPYDFDFTGFVNPVYAIPTDETGLQNIRQRLFTGMCRSKEDFIREVMEISRRKAELFSVINDFPYISQRSKKDLTGYLDQFMLLAENRNQIDNLVAILMQQCKKL